MYLLSCSWRIHRWRLQYCRTRRQNHMLLEKFKIPMKSICTSKATMNPKPKSDTIGARRRRYNRRRKQTLSLTPWLYGVADGLKPILDPFKLVPSAFQIWSNWNRD
ncbi:unnamed protein product [Lactuca virosa]|uniref:Uncharacterized protein n=1 Tax=Lactuca virosa TaxID=75947 RepID=A0AAU9P5I6_9ASTR|nr:unnamed protein product [Lactuca virosa]